jgi:hypothetical protein
MKITRIAILTWGWALTVIAGAQAQSRPGDTAPIPSLQGVWMQIKTGEVVRKGGPFEHFPNPGNEPTFGDPGKFKLTITRQEGAAFSATWASQARTDPIVGVISADGKSVFMVDDNGPMHGRLIGDDLEVCRALVDPNRMLAACRMLRRQ